jgi:peptidyl-tRNA hydrolase
MSDFEKEDVPRALNLVVRMEKGVDVYFGDVARAAGLAVLGLLYDERAANEWAEAIALWRAGRIRKLCRRARGAAWERTASLEHVEVSVGSATVRAFVPTLVDAQPPELAKLQLQGTEFAESVVRSLFAANTPAIRINPNVEMSGPKAIVAAAHALQLVVEKWEQRRPEAMLGWLSGAAEFSVERIDDPLWRTLCAPGADLGDEFCCAIVSDAGFTEVVPGTVTAVGLLFAPQD